MQDSSQFDDLQCPTSEVDCGGSDDQRIDIRYLVAVRRYRLTTLMRKILRCQFSVLAMCGKYIGTVKEAVYEKSTETAMRIKQIAAMQLDAKGSSQRPK
jgi:uncharacterized membrane protein YciS (DUF1049 family)